MGDPLATLIEDVQYELSQVASPAIGQQYREHIKNRINREYRRLYHDFDWPELCGWYTLETQAGEFLYDYPDDVTLQTTISVWRKHGNVWLQLDRGLSPDDYNVHDTEADARNDPAQKWQPRGTQFELWPIPATDDLKILFVAKRPFTPLVAEDDICDLDTDLVVLHAAAEMARRSSPEEASLLLGRAQQHYGALKNRNGRGTLKVNFATGAPQAPGMGFSGKTIIGVAPRDD